MRVVADTNTFLAVALREPEKESLTKVLAGHALIAPEVLPFEIGNALTAMVKKRTLDSEDVQAALKMVNTIPVDLRTIDMRAALDIAVRFRIYAYDAYYLECATRYRAPLLTLDIGMQRVARELAIEVVELPT